MFSLTSPATDWRHFQFTQSRCAVGKVHTLTESGEMLRLEQTFVFVVFLYFSDETASVLPENSGDSKQGESKY